MTEREKQAEQIRQAILDYARESPVDTPGRKLDERPWDELPDFTKGFFLAARDEAAAIFVPVKVAW